jgi:hypothetical protein
VRRRGRRFMVSLLQNRASPYDKFPRNAILFYRIHTGQFFSFSGKEGKN